MASVSGWLGALGLGQYAEAFKENVIGWDDLSHLNDSVLKDIGVSEAGHRGRILLAIKSLRASSSQYASSGTPELRQLTFLFCDLIGSTELADRHAPEDLRELVKLYQGECQSAIGRYGGFIARYLGDGILAYFGYPQAHEDDAERAVRAGLGIIDGMRKLNAEREVKLSVRIGIATGLVVIGDVIGEGPSREIEALGVAPNLASRLQNSAEPNTVVIAPLTRRLALNNFEYHDLGKMVIKGLSEPINAWQVLGKRTTEGRFAVRQMSGTTPLVGRAEELALILRRWEQAKDREGQVVLLSGEPGIGKSRLAEVLREKVSAEPHTLVVRYQCSPYHTHSALYPIVEQIRRAAEFDETDSACSQLDKLEKLLRRAFDDVSEVAPLFAALLSIDAGDRYPVSHLQQEALKEATLKALADQIFACSAKQPVLLIMEDAHWIDPTTQEVLDMLLPDIADKHVLAVITHRPEYRPPPWSELAHAMTLPVVRLPRRDVVLMIEKMAGGKPLAQDVLEHIIAKTDGVPLFVEELTKTIIESGLIVETKDSYRVSDSLPEWAIPETLQDSLTARLDRASRREVAQVGACIGRHFSREMVAAVLALDETQLNDTLRELEAAGLLFRIGTPTKVSYAFKHALVRDAAYNSLLKKTRRHFHASIAEFLSKSGDAAASSAEVLAHHYTEAGEFARAASHWYEAAERAEARYANREAIAHCRKGLTALSHLARSPEHTSLELALRIRLATGLRITDHHTEALAELGAAAEAVTTESEHLPELSRIHHMRGNIYYPLGKIKSCFDEHEAALRFAKKAGATEEESYALGGLGDAHFLAGRIQQAHQHFEECVFLARENGLLHSEVAYLPMRAVTHMYCLRFDEALDDCDSVINLATRVGHARGEIISRSTSSWILMDQCEFGRAEQHARKGLEVVEAIGARRFIPLFNDVLARIRLHDGDAAGALDLLEKSWKECLKAGETFAGPVVLGAEALATPDPRRRLEVLRQGEAILRQGCASHNHFRFYRDAIEVSLRERLWDAADHYSSALEDHFGANASPWSDFFIARGRALAAAGRRGPEEAVVAELRQLRDKARRHGILAAVAGLDEALSDA
jgi:class 3 adenylate cyclase/tetratricopeptide (TPR) repeat protein